MESAGRLRHQEPHPARAASEPAPSDAYVGNPGGLPGTQERRRTRHPNALARVAISRTPHRHVETPRSYGALATCVQPKIWVTISPEGEGCFSDVAAGETWQSLTSRERGFSTGRGRTRRRREG